VATDAPGTIEVLKAAYNHKGASVCEILQNCVIFNNGTHDAVYSKEGRAKNAIYLRHGEKMLFGENNEYGIVQEGFNIKPVSMVNGQWSMDDVLVHDAKCEDNTLQLKLAEMEWPVALGVIRDVEAPTYDDCVWQQVEEVKAKKKYHNFAELLETNDIWTVSE
ncbi:MAG: 2-oxoacid:ferredoxin oxidoreductase subunit beta, partial [Bacteroidaceae bacterium]|nr:2-oxoacid:ferredoxin oxidoreductase subunit beta [Bacteroidaceae bacterium]